MANTGKHILLVEDNPDIALSLTDMLKHKGFKVTLAESADNALNLLNDKIDIALTDYQTPGRSTGLDVIKKAAENNIPSIMYSSEPGIKNLAISMGATSFLQKPGNTKLIIDAIEGAIAKHELTAKSSRTR